VTVPCLVAADHQLGRPVGGHREHGHLPGEAHFCVVPRGEDRQRPYRNLATFARLDHQRARLVLVEIDVAVVAERRELPLGEEHGAPGGGLDAQGERTIDRQGRDGRMRADVDVHDTGTRFVGGAVIGRGFDPGDLDTVCVICHGHRDGAEVSLLDVCVQLWNGVREVQREDVCVRMELCGGGAGARRSATGVMHRSRVLAEQQATSGDGFAVAVEPHAHRSYHQTVGRVGDRLSLLVQPLQVRDRGGGLQGISQTVLEILSAVSGKAHHQPSSSWIAQGVRATRRRRHRQWGAG
jgi:hypothetical protein